MGILRKCGLFLKDPVFRMNILSKYGFFRGMPDRQFLEKRYRICMGRTLDLDAPGTYTEKLQWLKLYDRRPMYTEMVDKALAKEFAAQCIGRQYIIPTLGIWDRFEDIDFDSLPRQFVLKCTHDSGGLVICRDKSRLDREKARKKIETALKRNYYWMGREWPYRDVKPRILAEAYMEDSRIGQLRDYKFFTFGGEPKIMYITQGRRGESVTADFLDMDFHRLELKIDHEMSPQLPEKLENFQLMQELAAKLSAGTPQLRVDFYEVDGRVYFGELTFFHCSGMVPLQPEAWDEILGSWVKLPKKTNG